MKRTLCIILFILFSLSLCGCGGETIYFDKELKEEETFLKQATAHFPLSFSCTTSYGDWETTLTIDENGIVSGIFSDPDYRDRGDGYENGTVYTSTFTGEFANYELKNDYTINLYFYNLSTERDADEEWLDVTTATRYIATDPVGITEGEAGYTLFTPDAPKAAVPNTVIGALSYSTSESIGVYALVNNKSGEVFVENYPIFLPEYS